MGGGRETRKISRKINDRPVYSLSLDPTPRRAYEIQFTACAISLQLVKRMTCQPRGVRVRSGGPLVNDAKITANQCFACLSPIRTKGVS
jgi:hypothetical protein